MIPKHIKIKNNQLPDEPGVYFYFDENNEVLYIGKATSLKDRVGSYFTKVHNDRISQLVVKIARINYIETSTVIEALVLEANQIKAHKPPFNILQRDDKSFLYLVITNEDFSKPLLMRGLELENLGINPFDKTLSAKAKKKFLAVYGPYTSGHALKKALNFVRRIIPWSDCDPPSVSGRTRPCFYRHIKKCPGVCTGEISKTEYRKIIKKLMLFFEGKKGRLISQLDRDMQKASKERRFEDAAAIRNQIFALQHIQDVAFITKEDVELPVARLRDESLIDLEGRIEAYDISNISGTSAVGSMIVFEEGQPAKDKYRKFKIKTVQGANDTAMMQEVIRRRLRRAERIVSPPARGGARGGGRDRVWELPELMVIDGGKGQINAVQKILDEFQVEIPIVGLTKGFDRKQDRLVFDRANLELARVAKRGKEVFQKARDEAHRFAVKYHRELRAKRSGTRR